MLYEPGYDCDLMMLNKGCPGHELYDARINRMLIGDVHVAKEDVI